ncbi:hypothetical protein BGZ70_003475 [Mortierella alpina]|uniref:Endonuclease/exonuclease/phosphatase domain-containing protein n=1 Tax=Mortierella alpina TaxID=64518 RepID=A0A9P6ISQ9_MORAP|nr:hypothetical protein BGZ70_003475 [Mortierella alpina]
MPSLTKKQLEIMAHRRPQPNPSVSTRDRPIRCLQWNIERNYKAAEILATLTEIDADILCIQEIDIGCHRSGHERDHFLEICRSQGLYGGFVPEFWELEHPGRKDRDQGGGVHGNAILSKWPVNGFRVLDHVHHAYEWERDGMKLNEPRLGRRFTIVADIQTPSGPLLCCCAHLEVFTGIVGRISALSDILADSELYSDRYPYQILFGDLNTISHSIARLAKTISSDQYRIGSVGSQEAEWWDRNLWSWHIQDGEFNLALATGGWQWLRRLGFLGMGIGQKEDGSEQETSAFWSSDAKYTGWLRKLVCAGLETVKQARLEQLLRDKFTSAACEHSLDSELSPQQQQEHLQHAMEQSILQEEYHTAVTTEEAESYRSYQEDGSIILVGRPRSSSIVTLESSLMDRSDYMSPASSSAWSSPTTAFIQHYELHGESDEDEDEDGDGDGHSGEFKLCTDTTRDVRDLASTPSTPSPTLRLIPPTPKQSRPNTVFGSLTGREDPFGTDKRGGDEERGIPLPYEDEDENDDYDQVDRVTEYRHRHERSRTHQDDEHTRQHSTFTNTQPHDNDLQYPNDPNATMAFTTATTTTDTTSRLYDHPATTCTTTTVTATTYSTLTATSSTGTAFQDPQPPFLLSALQTSHAFFSTQRLWSGFTPLVLHQARNPGFYDPWCARNDLTLHNPNFFGILKAKLDYSLLKNLRCVGREMGNHDYSASDHKWLLVEVEFEREFKTRLGDAGSTTTTATAAAAVDVKGVECESKEWVIPSKEQQYLWWRERRLEWGQTVQPLPPHLRKEDAAMAPEEQARSLQRENSLLRKHPHQRQRHARHQQQQQQEHPKKKRALSMTAPSMIAAAVAAVAIGGFWLWGGRK